MKHNAFTLGHVHIKVKDLEKAAAFYTNILGLEIAERVGTYIFFSYGMRHHDLAIHQVPPDAASPGLKDVGLYHFAFEVPDLGHLASLYRKLKALNVPVRPIDHGISKVLYFRDPDGNGIEVYVDTRGETGRKEWQGQSSPLNIEDVSE
jgi:catechol 2,3-dioxygenase